MTGLFRSILQAKLRAEGIGYLVPEVSNRINSRDGGIDALLSVSLELDPDRTPGLINHGTTVYQFKWRSGDQNIVSSAKGELAKLRDGNGLPDKYVFVTNRDLTTARRGKIREALREDCAEFPEQQIVLVGGGELSDLVNDDPRIRTAFFATELGLCPHPTARQFAKQKYPESHAIELLGRDAEIAILRDFLSDDERRVLLVYGPLGSGKTRLVLDALDQHWESVVWTREVPPQPSGLIQLLDESPDQAILVFDGLREVNPGLVDFAKEASKTKTIITSLWRPPVTGITELTLRPLSPSDSASLLETASAEVPYAARLWIHRQFGGLPGMLIEASRVFRGAHLHESPSDVDFQPILDAYVQRMTEGASNAAESLLPLSLMPPTNLAPDNPDLLVLCEALGLQAQDCIGGVELLAARGLLELDATGFQVTPSLLAAQLARQALIRIADLGEVFHRLTKPAQAALVRRTNSIVNSSNVRSLLEGLFGQGGIFENLDSMASAPGIVLALAEVIPRLTAREIRRVLNGYPASAIMDGVTGTARRLLVNTLEMLAHTRDGFEDAATGLLCLGAGENETFSNNASELFVELFHWQQPQIPSDARLRVNVLKRFSTHECPERRTLVARAAGFALRTEFTAQMWQGEGANPPETGWQPRIWGEVRDAVRPCLGVLKQLIEDECVQVQVQAMESLARGARGLLSVGLWTEAIETLEELATEHGSGPHRAEIIEGLALVVDDLALELARDPSSETREELVSIQQRARVAYDNLTGTDFANRLKHWTGPHPLVLGADGRITHDFGETKTQAVQLAEEAHREPELLSPELLDWITDLQGGAISYFLWKLGELDRHKVMLTQLEDRLSRTHGLPRFLAYLMGRATVAREEVEAYLDEIVPRGGLFADVALEATCELTLGPASVERIGACIAAGSERHKAAWLVSIRSNLEESDSDTFSELLHAIRDGSPEVDSELIGALDRRWSTQPSDRHHLSPLVRQVLTNAVSVRRSHSDSYEWDRLAAHVAAADFDAGFSLLFCHLDVDPRLGCSIAIEFNRSQLIEALTTHDRPKLVRALLSKALVEERNYDVANALEAVLLPELDRDLIIEFCTSEGIEAAVLVSEVLDPSKPGFWPLLEDLARIFGTDNRVESRLVSAAASIRGVYHSEASELTPRVEELKRLSESEDSNVRSIALQALDSVNQRLKAAGS